MIGSFAGRVFSVSYTKINTFKELKHTAKLETEKTDVQGGKPTTTIKGAALDTLSCTVILNSQFGVNPRAEWEAFLEILNAAKPAFFILGDKPLRNCRWLLTEVTSPFEDIDAVGDVNSIELSLTFEEFVKAGAAKSSTATKEAVTGAAAGITTQSPYNFEAAKEFKMGTQPLTDADLKAMVEGYAAKRSQSGSKAEYTNEFYH